MRLSLRWSGKLVTILFPIYLQTLFSPPQKCLLTKELSRFVPVWTVICNGRSSLRTAPVVSGSPRPHGAPARGAWTSYARMNLTEAGNTDFFKRLFDAGKRCYSSLWQSPRRHTEDLDQQTGRHACYPFCYLHFYVAAVSALGAYITRNGKDTNKTEYSPSLKQASKRGRNFPKCKDA